MDSQPIAVIAPSDGDQSLEFSLAAFACGLLVLERGADRFVDSSAFLARQLGVSPTLVSLLTCGAEWEELVVVAAAMSQRQGSLALGNLMGSSVANILGSFSLGLLCSRQEVMRFDQSSRIYTAILIVLTVAFLVMLYIVPAGQEWAGGIALIVTFAVYVASVVSMIYKGSMAAPENDSDSDSDTDSDAYAAIVSESEQDLSPSRRSQERRDRLTGGRNRIEVMVMRNRRPKKWRKHATQVVLGLFMMVVSGYVLAQSASKIGESMGLSSTVTGATILSVATTLPEKMVAVLAGARCQPGILVANTVGSNMFLITLCGGVLLVGSGNTLQNAFSLAEVLSMGFAAIALLLVVLAGGRRWMGFLLVLGYLLFLGTEFVHGASNRA